MGVYLLQLPTTLKGCNHTVKQIWRFSLTLYNISRKLLKLIKFTSLPKRRTHCGKLPLLAYSPFAFFFFLWHQVVINSFFVSNRFTVYLASADFGESYFTQLSDFYGLLSLRVPFLFSPLRGPVPPLARHLLYTALRRGSPKWNNIFQGTPPPRKLP